MVNDEFTKIEPNVWKPQKKGDTIVGTLVKSVESNKYKGTKIHHLEVVDEESGAVSQAVLFGTKVLDDRMSFVKPGQRVKVVYGGEEKNSKDQDTKLFEVFVGK